MGAEWYSATVGDALELVNGFAFKSRDFLENGVPVIKIKNVKAGYFSEHDFSYVDPTFLLSRKDKLARFDDLLISMSGNRHDGSPETWVGKVALFRKSGNYFINQRVGALRLKDLDRFDPRFMSYLLSSWKYQSLFISVATSSGGQANLSPGQILSAPIEYPDFRTQKAIAGVLGSLDDKIELNRQINTTLESMAQALFKSWFVDFDPVIDNALAAGNPIPDALQARAEKRKALHHQPSGTGSASPLQLLPADIRALFPDSFVFNEEMGWVPEGWDGGTVGSEFNVTMGQSPPGDTYNEAGNGLPFFQGRADFGFRFPSNRVFCTDPKRFAQEGDTLVSVRAPVGDVNMASENCSIGRGVAAVRYKQGSVSYSYYAMRQLRERFAVYEGEGTVFGSINQKDFNALPQLVLTGAIINAFDEIAAPIDRRIGVAEAEMLSLVRMRDFLLPKLLSGEIRAPEVIDKIVESA